MCGIAGIVNLNQKQVDKKSLEKMIKIVKYRGPNDEGYFINENIGLGHCRLSIIDLSRAGHQPMSNENNTIWVVHNGEIYNYLELRNELKKAGHIFKSDTDTEVIIHAYEEWGNNCFEKFNGMWAFAIADLTNKKIILSRDRFSIKPLYYIFSGKTLYFGSEIKQLLPFLDKKEINVDVMFNFLKQGILDFNQDTFFRNIYKVKPMHNLIIDLVSKEIKEVKYWDYCEEEIPKDEREIIEKFRDLFIDSVRIRLRSDVPLGVLLSGGLDSSSIAVIANKLTDNQLNCFSVVSEDKKYSEEKFVDILTKETGIKTKKLFLEPKLAWDKLEDVIFHQDEPFVGFSVIAQNQILELIKKEVNITVLLSGQGGDEILAGYRKFFFFYLQEEFKKGHFLDVSKNLFFSLINRTILWQVLRESNLWPGARKYLSNFSKKKTDSIDEILKIRGKLEPLGKAENLKERQILDIDYYSIPALTHYEDRNSMAYSLEIRSPFLDYRLVNFVLNLSNSFKIRNGWTKYILRNSLTELPKDIAWRRYKRGFITPEEKWLKHDFKDEITNIFKKSRLHEMGILDKEKLLENYNEFLRRNKGIWYLDLVRFVIAELWVRKFAK